MTLLVVGTGRCGTGYTSTLLNKCGVKCGHEDVYGPLEALGRKEPDWQDYAAECSWMGVSFAKDFEGKIVRQIRDPLLTIDSLIRIGMFRIPEEEDATTPFRQAAADGYRGLYSLPNPWARATAFVADWTEGLWASTYRVEDLSLQRLVELGWLAGVNISNTEAYEALETTPTNTNGIGGRRESEDIAQRIKDHVPQQIVADLVTEYGDYYDLSVLV